MEDQEIIKLYLTRDEAAILETERRYGGYCRSIARNLLGSEEDAEECANDTFLRAWNAIPPHLPRVLATYLGKITRHLSLDRYRRRRADKRGGGQLAVVLDELAECLAGPENVEEAVDNRELGRVLNDFLGTLPRDKCDMFLCRYWYAWPIADIAARMGMTENHVAVALCRLRSKLKSYLIERGYDR